LQDKHNIGRLSEVIIFAFAAKQALFLNLAQKNYMISENIRILSINTLDGMGGCGPTSMVF
jgi:hypothetical protein